jgi:hypothetical protein
MNRKEFFAMLFLLEMLFSLWLTYELLYQAEIIFTRNSIGEIYYHSRGEADEFWKRVYLSLVCLSFFYLALMLFLDTIPLNKCNTNISTENLKK